MHSTFQSLPGVFESEQAQSATALVKKKVAICLETLVMPLCPYLLRRQYSPFLVQLRHVTVLSHFL
mgnify:CR=1 FL=1